MTINCLSKFTWSYCWSGGSKICCDPTKSGPIFFVTQCNLPCNSVASCSSSEVMGSYEGDPNNKCETEIAISVPGVILLLFAVAYLFSFFKFWTKRSLLQSKPWAKGPQKSPCPFTGLPPVKVCSVCFTCVSTDAFIADLNQSYSTTSTSGNVQTTSYHTQYKTNYNHCVGCHAVNSTKRWIWTVFVGGLTFAIISLVIGSASSADDRMMLEEKTGALYGLGVPVVLAGFLGGCITWRGLYGGVIGKAGGWATGSRGGAVQVTKV